MLSLAVPFAAEEYCPGLVLHALYKLQLVDTLGPLPAGTVINISSVNTHAQVFAGTRVFMGLEQILRSGIPGLYIEYVFNFIK